MIMPRLKHARTGVVIDCSDETAARMAGEWRPVEQAKSDDPGRPRKRSPKRSE